MKNIVCIKELFEPKGKPLQPANHPHIPRIILLGALYNLHAEDDNDSGVLENPMGVFTPLGLPFLTPLTSESACNGRDRCPPIFR